MALLGKLHDAKGGVWSAAGGLHNEKALKAKGLSMQRASSRRHFHVYVCCHQCQMHATWPDKRYHLTEKSYVQTISAKAQNFRICKI